MRRNSIILKSFGPRADTFQIFWIEFDFLYFLNLLDRILKIFEFLGTKWNTFQIFCIEIWYFLNVLDRKKDTFKLFSVQIWNLSKNYRLFWTGIRNFSNFLSGPFVFLESFGSELDTFLNIFLQSTIFLNVFPRKSILF